MWRIFRRRNRRCLSPRPLLRLHGEGVRRLWPQGSARRSSAQSFGLCSAVGSPARSSDAAQGQNRGGVSVRLSAQSPSRGQRGCSPGSFPPAAGHRSPAGDEALELGAGSAPRCCLWPRQIAGKKVSGPRKPLWIKSNSSLAAPLPVSKDGAAHLAAEPALSIP